MSADEDKATFVRLIELINNKDLSYVDEVFAPEYVLHAPDGTVDREGYKKSMQAMLTAFPDWHCRVDQIIADGHAIAARITVTGTNTGPLVLPQGTYPPTGKKVEQSAAEIGLLRDGRVIEGWEYYDQLALMLQLGLMPAPAVPAA